MIFDKLFPDPNSKISLFMMLFNFAHGLENCYPKIIQKQPHIFLKSACVVGGCLFLQLCKKPEKLKNLIFVLTRSKTSLPIIFIFFLFIVLEVKG